jgi:lysozyme family protein
MTLHTFHDTWDTRYRQVWDACHVVKVAEATAAAGRISAPAARAALEHVQKLTAVPWTMVGCVLLRESNLNFGTYLGNGQPLNQRTTIVPIDRGPFLGPNAFYDGCVDALTLEGITGFDPANWTIDRVLYWLERLNGQGYYPNPSPYLWAGTDRYTKGKYVKDHVYDPNVVDTQLGCAAVLKILEAQGIVTFPREAVPAAVPQPQKAPTVATAPVPITAAAIKAGTPATATQFFAEAEAAVALVQKYVGMLSRLIPEPWRSIVTGALPVLDDALKIVPEIQAAHAAGGSVLNVVGAHLQAIGAQLQALSPAAATVTVSSTAAGMVVNPPPQTPG